MLRYCSVNYALVTIPVLLYIQIAYRLSNLSHSRKMNRSGSHSKSKSGVGGGGVQKDRQTPTPRGMPPNQQQQQGKASIPKLQVNPGTPTPLPPTHASPIPHLSLPTVGEEQQQPKLPSIIPSSHSAAIINNNKGYGSTDESRDDKSHVFQAPAPVSSKTHTPIMGSSNLAMGRFTRPVKQGG